METSRRLTALEFHESLGNTALHERTLLGKGQIDVGSSPGSLERTAKNCG